MCISYFLDFHLLNFTVLISEQETCISEIKLIYVQFSSNSVHWNQYDAMIIIVGSLKMDYFDPRNFRIWIEKKYIYQSKIVFMQIGHMLQIAKKFCDPMIKY